jgi:starch synthase
MRVSIMSKEWPPEIYGGAGVHVDQLVPQLRRLVEVDVQCFGAPRPDALAHATPAELATANAALQTLGVDLAMAQAAAGADLVHSHTWYANMGGHLASLLHGIPHVITAHSLEPLRPWKAEQLGGGYRVSSWAEATAYEAAAGIIAVSNGMRNDVLSAYPKVDPDRVYVVHNGIDTQVYTPTQDEEVLRRFGIATDRPFVLFVGRITRQKGLPHLLRAMRLMSEQTQLVLCASSPDTPELGQEVRDGVAALRAEHGDDSVIWIEEMVSKQDVIVLYSQAAVFVCPSVYEPLGIVNLEAMACGTAVVASDVGGIPEVVDNGNTGFLAHYDPQATDAFEAELASALDRVVADPAMAAKMGADGRIRADEYFGWDAIAAKTVDVYRAVSGA